MRENSSSKSWLSLCSAKASWSPWFCRTYCTGQTPISHLVPNMELQHFNQNVTAIYSPWRALVLCLSSQSVYTNIQKPSISEASEHRSFFLHFSANSSHFLVKCSVTRCCQNIKFTAPLPTLFELFFLRLSHLSAAQSRPDLAAVTLRSKEKQPLNNTRCHASGNSTTSSPVSLPAPSFQTLEARGGWKQMRRA